MQVDLHGVAWDDEVEVHDEEVDDVVENRGLEQEHGACIHTAGLGCTHMMVGHHMVEGQGYIHRQGQHDGLHLVHKEPG